MTLSDIGILAVWHALGGGALRGRRGAAFWRGGDGYSVSLNPERGTWYDFRDGRGGGVLSLVEAVLSCDRAAALAWLETHCGLDPRKPLLPEQRRAHARANATAPALAQRWADFARGLEIISERRMMLARAANIDAECVPHWHSQAATLAKATAADIARLWEVMPDHRDAVEALGSRDREHAEVVTRAMVDALAATQERRAA